MFGWRSKKEGDKKPPQKRRLKTLFLAAVLGLCGTAAASRGIDVVRHTPPDEAVISAGMKAQEHHKQVSPAIFPDYSRLPPKWQAVMDRSGQAAGIGGADIYAALSFRQKACLLNIFAKAQATQLPDGSTVIDHLGHLREIRQDRVFLTVDATLSAQLDASDASSGAFYHRGGIDGVLHRARENFDKYASYKTHDKRGAFDITLSHDGRVWMAEMDIDYYRGFRHFVFEVAYNHVLDTRTDPVKVEKILRERQGIDPGYRPK